MSALVLYSCLASGCSAPAQAPIGSVGTVWQQRGHATPAPQPQRRLDQETRTIHESVDAIEPVIATVNGQPITRQRVIGLLLESRGVGILEQLIGLETAIRAASRRGLVVTQSDLDREHDRALRNLSDPLSSVTPSLSDREEAERLLDQVLAQRNMSRSEFDIITRRNAYLRKLAESELLITEAQLRREYERIYGERVQVRHIQLATLPEVTRIRERLAKGEDFAELAARYSANTSSAQAGGLLDPFSAGDENLPAALRQTAFALEPGEVSSTVRVGEWYHLLTLENRLPAEARDFAAVRDDLERSLRDRLTQSAMFTLFEKLFRDATIEIHDPDLDSAFRRKHPDRVP